MRNIIVGIVTKPHGLKGDVRVKLVDVNTLDGISTVFIDGQKYTIEKSSLRPNIAILKFSDVHSYEEADILRNKEITTQVDKITLTKNQYLVEDLLNKKIITDSGKEIGKLVAIEGFGSADVFTVIDSSGKEIYFPFARGIIKEVGDDIIIKEKVFNEVGVY